MTRRIRRLIVIAACVAACVLMGVMKMLAGEATTSLPPPRTTGKMSLEEAVARRRSVRKFQTAKLTSQQISQLCWAAQGITAPNRGFRAAPSAGALYPLELFVVTPEGVEHYVPEGHRLRRHLEGDVRGALQKAALGQEWVGKAPAVFVITAVVSRTQRKYGRRAQRYVWIEVGHVGQNILLQGTAMGLGGVPVGAFVDADVAKVLKLPRGHTPLYLIPVGKPAP